MNNKYTDLRNLYRFSLSKLFLFLLIVSKGFSAPLNGQELLEREVSVSFNGETLDQVIDVMTDDFDIKFTYNSRDLNFEEKIFYKAEKEPIGVVLENIFDPIGISYLLIDDKIALKKKPESKKVSSVSTLNGNDIADIVQDPIRGIVYDEGGIPLPGASVIILGTTTGTTTDFNGEFSIAAKTDDQLQFSYIGYQSQTIAIDNQDQLTVTLLLGANDLSEVVVTGYSSTSKRNLTGAISKVDAEVLSLSTATNLSKGLQGAVTGLVVRQGSPQPGYDDNPIYIRGTGSFNNSEALVVIDGVPDRQGGLSRLNPEEIESISVIKDATAAVYGSRSANGVIVVTTKNGKPGEVDINYSSVFSFDQPAFMPKGLNKLEWVTWHKEGYDYIGGSPDPIYSDAGIQAYQNGTADGYIYPNGKSIFDLAFDKNYWSPRSKHNISFSGGTEKTKYFLSASISDQGSSIKDDISKFEQANIRMNIEQKLTDFLTLSSNILVRKEDNALWPGGDPRFWATPQNTPNALGRFLIQVYQKGPLAQVYWPNGSKTSSAAYIDQIKGEGGRQNASNLFIQSNFDATLRIPSIEGLQFKATVALDNAYTYMKKMTKPIEVFNLSSGGTDASDLVPATLGSDINLAQYSTIGLNKLFQGVLSYETKINDHEIKTLFGLSREESNIQDFWTFRSNLVSSNTDVLSQGEVGTEQNDGGEFATARMNYFGNISYSYKNRYFLQLLTRYDGSYLFPESTRYGFFPGVSAGWVMSDEKFMENAPFDFLKLRASYGELGNDTVPANQFSSSFGTGVYVLGSGSDVYTTQTLNELKIGNPNITWEVAKNIDIGVEGTLLNNRLSFEVDYYKSDRNNILTKPYGSIADITGIVPPYQNIGKTTNKGWEYTLGYKASVGELDINTTAFVSTNDNTLIFADEPEGLDPAVSREGRRIGAWKYWNVIGVFQNQAQIDAHPVDHTAVGVGNTRPGDLIIEDVNGDGTINTYDYKFTDGSVIPKMTTSLNLQMNYKNFDFTARMYGTFGGYIDQWHGSEAFLSKHVYDNRWVKEGDQSEFGRALASPGGNPYTGLMIAKTDHIKLQYLELGYNVDSETLNNLFGIGYIDNVRLFVNGNDLFYKMFDDKLWSHPESFTGDYDNGYGVLEQLPPSETLYQKGTLSFANQSVSFGVNLKF
ncbi:MAG: SusC/RagA family TonB-linked outer membrane protein [Flavobacteriaceae bacterium]